MTEPESSGIPPGDLLPDFRRLLEAKRRSDGTIYLYEVAGQRLVDWLEAEDGPVRVPWRGWVHREVSHRREARWAPVAMVSPGERG